MLRALCLAMTFLVLPLDRASADTDPDLGANAALKYWQAFATLPPLTATEQRTLNAECLTMPLDDRARGMVARAAYSLRMLHYGAALSRCNWSLNLKEEGIGVLLPHNDAARVLASLACLQARLHLEAGHPAEAIDNLIDGMTLARHVSQDSVFVMVLAEYAIEHRMIEALALSLPRLDSRTIKDLKTRLGALPQGCHLSKALRMEEKWGLDYLIRLVKETRDPESLLALATRLCDTPEKGRQFLQECGGTRDGVLQTAEEARTGYEQMARHMDLPLDQFEKEWDGEQKKQAGNPVFRILFPAVEKARLAQARISVRRALLAAALDVQLDGRDALKKHSDPVVGGPFEYSPFEGGFELRSAWTVDEPLRSKWKLDERLTKPLTLTVGRRK
jgi:hypothetical protein